MAETTDKLGLPAMAERGFPPSWRFWRRRLGPTRGPDAPRIRSGPMPATGGISPGGAAARARPFIRPIRASWDSI